MRSDTLSRDFLPALIAYRDVIEAVMAQYLAGVHRGAATEEEKSAAHQLFGVMLDGLNGSASARQMHDLPLRRHASRFGDGLTPILKDVLGAEAPDAFVALCVDRFWATLQAAAA